METMHIAKPAQVFGKSCFWYAKPPLWFVFEGRLSAETIRGAGP